MGDEFEDFAGGVGIGFETVDYADYCGEGVFVEFVEVVDGVVVGLVDLDGGCLVWRGDFFVYTVHFEKKKRLFLKKIPQKQLP